MASMGGAEVGRVHIKVVPDFTEFRARMLAELKKWDNRDITWNIKADTKQLGNVSRDLDRNIKQASKLLKKDLAKGFKDATKNATKQSELAPDLSIKARYKRKMQRDLNKMFDDLSVNLNVKGSDNQTIVDYWDKEFKMAQKTINKLNPEMDTRVFSAQASYVMATLNKIRLESEKIRQTSPADALKNVTSKGELQDGLNKIREQRLETQRLARAAEAARLKLDNVFDGALKISQRQALREYVYGFRDLDGVVSRLTSTNNRIRMSGGIVGSLFGGAAGIGTIKLGGKAVTAVGEGVSKVGGLLGKLTPSFGTGLNIPAYLLIASVITPVIALLSGLIVAAPAAIAAVALPIAAITLGLEGIKKAAETVKPAFEKLRADLSAVFERGLVPGFETLRDKVIPGLTGSFEGLAGSLSTVFNEFTANLASEANMGFMNNIIKNTGIAAEAALPGIKNFTNGILDLVSELSNKFPGISEAINRTGDSFVKWVDKITTVDASGTTQLDRAMNTLGKTLSELGGIVSDLFANGFDNLGSVKFGESMKSFVQDIRSLVSDVLPALAGSFQVIATALRPIAAAVDSISKAVGAVNKISGSAPGGGMFSLDSVLGQASSGGPMTGLDKIQFVWDSIFNKEKARETFLTAVTGAVAGGGEALNAAGQQASEQYVQGMIVALGSNKEAQAQLLRSAFAPEGITEAVAGQITSQAQVAITGAQQALVPLKEGLQTDINAALMPLGDIAGKIAAAFNGVPALIQGSLGQIPALVTTNIGSIKTTTETSMQGFSDAVVLHLGIAVTTAQQQAPAIKAPFDVLAGQMFAVGSQMMQGLAQGITGSVGFATAAAAAAATRVKGAADIAAGIRSPSREFMKTGDFMMQGMQVGIQNGTDGPIAAMREVIQAIKDVFGSAEGLNLNFFMGGAAESMSSMATSSKEFRSNMVQAGTSPAVSSGLGTDQLDDIKRQKAEIDLRIAELQAQKNATTDKAAKAGLTGEIDQLRIQKERLDLLKEENGLQEDRKTAIQQLSDTIATNIQDMIKMPGDFAKATVSAAAQDLGISGSGAIPTIANWAMDAGTNYIFNVNNMDDALQGSQAKQRQQTLGITG